MQNYSVLLVQNTQLSLVLCITFINLFCGKIERYLTWKGCNIPETCTRIGGSVAHVVPGCLWLYLSKWVGIQLQTVT